MVMIFSTRSFLSVKDIPLFLLTFRSLVMPAASQKFDATSTIPDYFGNTQPVNQIKFFKEDDEDSSLQYTPFTIRLHLIRHGETLANLRKVVLGQGDSPLTENGLALAQMAAESSFINGRTETCRYWRTYCSDLYRAHRTAKIVLGLEDIHGNTKDVEHQQTSSPGEERESNTNLNKINLIVDPRLRELAKGAREGYLKSLSMEEAMSRRLQEAVEDNRHQLQQKIKVPKLESVSDAWARARDWVDSLVKDASYEYYSAKSTNESDDASCNTDDNETLVYNVFALSHSALIRTMIHKMVDSQLPKKYALTNEGSLLLPNLSRTIIDVHPYYSKKEKSGSSESIINSDITLRWKCRLVHLADVSHLSDDPSINRKGPPYL